MRRLISIFAALVVAGVLAAPASAAAPLENGWDTFTGSLFDQCTGEVVDNSGTTHAVLLANGLEHLNVQLVGIGESSGVTYVGHNAVAAPLPIHPSADGTFTATALVSVLLVSNDGSPNQMISFRDVQVFDSSGNLLSDTFTMSFNCRG